MAKLYQGLAQRQNQQLTPQQMLVTKLLELPTVDLEARILRELEENPALDANLDEEMPNNNNDSEESNDTELEDYNNETVEDSKENLTEIEDKIDLDDYLRDSDNADYKLHGDGPGTDEQDRESPLSQTESLSEMLLTQLGYLKLSPKQQTIGGQIIGSLDTDGYLRRSTEAIAGDLIFGQNIETNEQEIEQVLDMIHQFDPAGIAARSLSECLLLQLYRRTKDTEITQIAIRILEDYFDDFIKKHYEKIQKKLDILDYQQIKQAVGLITRLNPKPGDTQISGHSIAIIPDFVLANNNGKLELALNSKNAPELHISQNYTQLMKSYSEKKTPNKDAKQEVLFIKQKLDSARWFIDAIRQRQTTMMRVMSTIVELQYDFFLEADQSLLKPMILEDIAKRIEMDISTVSRVTTHKYVQTEFGVYPLKYFFSEGISTESGLEVSNKQVKQILKELVENEDKTHPLSDEDLETELNRQGFLVRRRTVAKYREGLGIPVARLRRDV